jgi:hypothetical protein
MNPAQHVDPCCHDEHERKGIRHILSKPRADGEGRPTCSAWTAAVIDSSQTLFFWVTHHVTFPPAIRFLVILTLGPAPLATLPARLLHVLLASSLTSAENRSGTKNREGKGNRHDHECPRPVHDRKGDNEERDEQDRADEEDDAPTRLRDAPSPALQEVIGKADKAIPKPRPQE